MTFYLITFSDMEDGSVSSHVRGLQANSEDELGRAEAILRKNYDVRHLRSIVVEGTPGSLFLTLADLEAEERERANA